MNSPITDYRLNKMRLQSFENEMSHLRAGKKGKRPFLMTTLVSLVILSTLLLSISF